MAKEEKFGVVICERGAFGWAAVSPLPSLDEAERAVVAWRRVAAGSPSERSYAVGVAPWPPEADADAQHRPESRDVQAALAWREKRDEHTDRVLGSFARVVLLCGELGRGDVNYLKQLVLGHLPGDSGRNTVRSKK